MLVSYVRIVRIYGTLRARIPEGRPPASARPVGAHWLTATPGPTLRCAELELGILLVVKAVVVAVRPKKEKEKFCSLHYKS